MVTAARLMELSRPSESQSLRIKTALGEMALKRGATLAKEQLTLYSRRLESEPIEYVLSVVRKMGEVPRRDGEAAFPPLGNIVEELRLLKARMCQQSASEKRRASDMKNLSDYVDFESERTGRNAQQILDEIRTPGFVGLKVEELERWRTVSQ
jgi:hypothetical protein